jgi:ribosome-binding factor A
MSKYRIERINETIKEVLSEIVLNEIKDPRVGLVTIVSVRTARDLATARIHFSVMGDQAQRDISMKILKGASGFMRYAIANAIDVQHAPDLRWVYDDSLDRAFRINEVLRETGTPSSTGEAIRRPVKDLDDDAADVDDDDDAEETDEDDDLEDDDAADTDDDAGMTGDEEDKA